MISLKVYCKGENVLLAACDAQLLGRKFSDKKLQLELGNFYKDKLVDAKTFVSHLEEATIANLVGKKTIALAIKAGFVARENIILIKNVPHAQVLKLEK